MIAARPGQSAAHADRAVRSEAPAAVGLGRGKTVYLNPYTGRGPRRGVPESAGLLPRGHRLAPLARSQGREPGGRPQITGACNLAFLFLVLSGIYLWVPREWVWSSVQDVLWFRRGLRQGARLQLAQRDRPVDGCRWSSSS